MSDDYPGMKFNDTFRGDEPTQYNACVGNNGNPSYREYADGFADAAIILIDKALTTLDIDEQIYPICFNMRHSVELRLKHQISQLKLIRSEISLDDFDSAGSHDIGNIWQYFKDKSEKVDKRFSPIVDSIDGFINDIAEIDPTGQTFRYPLSNESVKHLVDVSIINVVRLKERFTVLRKKLEELLYLSDSLIREYQQGTYTNNLSRVDIEKIAEKLPDISKWGEESFDVIRANLKLEYSISSRELSDAINHIKKHYEFSQKIGLHIGLSNAKSDDLVVFFNCLVRTHPLENYLDGPRIVNFQGVMDKAISRIKEDRENDIESINDCKSKIEIDALIEIFSLYEFGRYLDYSEYFQVVFNNEILLKPGYERSEQEISSAILHYVHKKNAYDFILRSLIFLGQKDIVDKLNKEFELSKYFDFIEDREVIDEEEG